MNTHNAMVCVVLHVHRGEATSISVDTGLQTVAVTCKRWREDERQREVVSAP